MAIIKICIAKDSEKKPLPIQLNTLIIAPAIDFKTSHNNTNTARIPIINNTIPANKKPSEILF